MRAWYFSENAYPYLPDGDRQSPRHAPEPALRSEGRRRALQPLLRRVAARRRAGARRHGQRAPSDRDQPQPAAPLVLAVLARITQARAASHARQSRSRTAAIRCASPKRWRWSTTIRAAASKSASCAACRTRSPPPNANPVRTTDRLWEAHDLIVKAWTTPRRPVQLGGPLLPPPPGEHLAAALPAAASADLDHLADAELERAIAEHGHIAATFLTGVGPTKRASTPIAQRRRELGLPMADDRLAYSGIVYVGDTDEDGYAGARKLMWVITHKVAAPQFKNPPGYAPPGRGCRCCAARPGCCTALDTQPRGADRAGDRLRRQPRHRLSPDRAALPAVGGYGHLLMLGQSGFLEHDDTGDGHRAASRARSIRGSRHFGCAATRPEAVSDREIALQDRRRCPRVRPNVPV